MKTKISLIMILMMLMSIFTTSAQTNTISIPNVDVAPGNTISLPINLDNTSDVVAIQFTLVVSDGISLHPSTATLSSARSDGHTVTMREIGTNKYMAMLFSMDNKAIIGRTGTVMTVNLSASSSLEIGTECPMTLSDVVIGAVDGSNLTTGYAAGNVVIRMQPDLAVSDVNTTTTTINPGDNINISWQVANVGDLSTKSGWSEQIYLDGDNGVSKLLATTYYDNTLDAGGIVSRSAEISVPEILGLHGDVSIRVKLTPNSDSGEPSWLKDNNTALMSSTVNVKKKLQVTPELVRLDETYSLPIRFYLSRSGYSLDDETYSLDATADSRVSIPDNVTIEAGQSGAYFYAQLSSNGILDNDSTIVITITGHSYPEIHAKMVIEDDTFPSLSISASNTDVSEGESLSFTIIAERAPFNDLDIKLTNDFPNRFGVPSPIILAAGQNSMTVVVETIEDETPDVDQIVTFGVSAPKYNPANTQILLIDNDVPSLQLSLSPTEISEAAGPLSVGATLRRVNNKDKTVIVRLSDDSDDQIYYGQRSIEMPAGVDEVTFNLGPIDNAIVDGERTYNISAAVWIASCGCSSNNTTSGGIVTVPLTIFDNDGPALTMTSSKSAIKEGDEITITVNRNTDTTNSLIVNISSDHDSTLDYPATVTIPAGEVGVSFVVKSNKNDVTGDDFTAILTAVSEGYAKGNIWFLVTDQTLPDAKITSIEVSETDVVVGEDITVSVVLTNSGSYTLPEQTKIGFYLDNNSSAVAYSYLQSPLAPGDSVLISKTITLPDAVDSYRIYVTVNDDQSVKELLYANNTSAFVNVNAKSPYTFNAQTDKLVYKQGEIITITGSISGKEISNKAIDIYIINDGYRHVIESETDEFGHFSTTYEPFAGQVGVFVVGACYPGDSSTEEMTSFNMYGLKRDSNKSIICEALLGETYHGSYTIINPGVLSLSNIKTSVIKNPENCTIQTTCPTFLEGNATATVDFDITSSEPSEGNNWENIVIKIETAEGAVLETTLLYYCYNTTGKIKASVASIRTTMVKDSSRDYPFIITNIGKGETGKITLELQPWMTAVTSKEMTSLASGDSATVILRLTPTESMQLNVPQTGQIGINCENGIGLALPFSIEPVSTTTGVLTIDVCDENTYYTAESPHVQGAQVKISHPTTGELIASGTTDEDGLYSVTLNEGYYAVYVTADGHDSYRNNILVDPGTEKNVVVNLSIEAISVNWEAEEIEIEDEYSIVTTVKFETNVPVPVLELLIPTNIAAKELAKGESLVFNATITNKGLITARDVQLSMPGNFSVLTFEQLISNVVFDLAPQQSVQIPIKVTHPASGESRAVSSIDDEPCASAIGILYYWDCGEDRKWHRYEVALQVGTCKTPPTSISTGGGYIDDVYPHGGGGGGYIPSYSSGQISSYVDKGCEPCQNQMLRKWVDCGLSFIPVYGCVYGSAQCGESMTDGDQTARDYIGCTLTGIGCTMELCTGATLSTVIGAGAAVVCKTIGTITNVISCLVSFTEPCNLGRASVPSYIQDFQNKATIPLKEATAYKNKLFEFFGDEAWTDISYEEVSTLLNTLYVSDDDIYDADNFMEVKPENLSVEKFRLFIDRLNNTTRISKGESITSDNYIHSELMSEYDAAILEAEKESKELGYESTNAMWIKESADMKVRLDESSSSVCSSITLQIEQKMVMTRQAFRGTLTVYNGNETNAMTDVKLNLIVTDEDGFVATSHEFQIEPESLDGFVGNMNFEDGWTLDGKTNGVAKVLFIPTKYAAPTVDRLYSFGGTLSYTDPFSGLTVTRDLTPVTLTVKPSPILNLTYFMQRDVLGDDPLTGVIEPCEDAEFSLLINNIGYGDAKNVRMTTNQPKIIENEKGLYIDFEFVSSQLNGGEKNLALGNSVETDFGNIPAQNTSYAQWWLRSSLLGHFTEYDIKATHVTSYGNPDLSLLNEVSIHELIRSLDVEQGGDSIIGFMTNDKLDADDAPDMLYLSNGEIEDVFVTTSVKATKVSTTKYTLTVTPSSLGWNYGNITDPTYGVVKLTRVIRQSDGKEMSLRNFWQTDRTLRDGKEPLYENRIHFADEFKTNAEETYVLTFEPMPDLVLEVVSFEGVPTEGTVATSPVDTVKVVFNKNIDPTTFTSEDISLAVQGIKKDVSLINISTDDNKTFVLDLKEINKTCDNGYYVLNVQTVDITDSEGYKGQVGKSANWVMFRDGRIRVNVSVNPKNSGTVIGNIDVQYGDSISLSVEENKGYEFSHWTIDKEENVKDRDFNSIAIGDMDIVANLMRKSYLITVDDDLVGGRISGYSTGFYSYGDTLSFKVEPETDYVLNYWIVDNKKVNNDESLRIVVDTTMTISAKFKYIGKYAINKELNTGWNWVSSYLDEAIPIDVLSDYTDRLLGQFDESINDPEFGFVGGISAITPGLAFKIKANKDFSLNYEGYLHNLDNTPISLKKGWNWISYPYFEERSVESVITNAEEGDYLLSQLGFIEFADGSWEGSINKFVPGDGYLYKSSSDKILVFDFEEPIELYPESGITSVLNDKMASAKDYFELSNISVDIHKYPNTMNITAKLFVNEEEVLDGCYVIYAMAGTELRGIGLPNNDKYYLTIYGDKSTDIAFVVENIFTGETFIADESLLFANGIVGSRKKPYTVSVGNVSGIKSLEQDNRGLTIYNIDGLLIKDSAGMNDVKALSSGLYIINGKKYLVK